MRLVVHSTGFLLALSAALAPCSSHALDAKRAEVQNFMAHMHERHGFERAQLQKLFAQVESKQSIVEAISRPAERVVPWHEYRDRFLTPERIRRGVEFMQGHRARLESVQSTGVAIGTIVGILGVETIFGRSTGKYRVLDALSTLAFDYPPRGDFFRNELEQFLLLTREENLDPLLPLGSYAGAMGAPQFIPTSYRKFAIDGDKNGRRDLWREWDDVVGSIANYLAAHGWRAGEPVLTSATLASDDLSKFDVTKPALNETVQSLKEKGVRFDTELPATAPALLIVHQGKTGTEYLVGFNNFYVITRYNRSSMYARAVHELGTAIVSANSQ